ncbi:MAG: type II toxin-antitoxin system VapC family toxin [Thermoanaerobaculia bacterium]|nr:MAG: type II toxin-antitoxin system VapC family toxin [Thermoanaerobaculia bacterium]
MTVLVVDSSVLVAAVTDAGPLGEWAEERLAGAELATPHLALCEAGNVLRRLARSGTLAPREAAAAHRDLLDLDLELFPYAPFAERVWALAAAVTAYDAWYVALAEALGAPLATLDRRLARAPGPRCRFLTPSQ